MREDKFERLYAEHAGALYSFLASRTGDRALAEDLLADTFERALRSRRVLSRRRGQEKSWLFTVALNLVRDHARRVKSESRALHRELAGTAETSEAELEQVVIRSDVASALAALSDIERETVTLRFGGGLTVPELARVTGERVTTIEGRLYRALRKLGAEFDGRT